jgi:hypothetical protein
MRSYLKEKLVAPARKPRLMDMAAHHADHATALYLQKLALKFADERQ